MNAAQATAAARRFGIDALDARPLEGGCINDVWLLQTEPPMVLRRYGRLHVHRSAVAFEHAVIAHAARRLAFVAEPQLAPEGESFLLEDGAFIAVFPFAKGATGDRSLAPLAAAALAAFHRAMVDFHPAPGSGARAARSLGVLPWLRERFLRLGSAPALARALDWDLVLRGCAVATMGAASSVGALPIVVAHGDPHPDNFVMNNGAVSGLLDFDFAHETERVYDVAVLVDEYGRADDDGPLDLERCAATLAAYHAAAALSFDELRLLPEFMLRRHAMMLWHIVNRHSQIAPGDVGNAGRYVRRIEETLQRAQDLRSLHA